MDLSIVGNVKLQEKSVWSEGHSLLEESSNFTLHELDAPLQYLLYFDVAFTTRN